MLHIGRAVDTGSVKKGRNIWNGGLNSEAAKTALKSVALFHNLVPPELDSELPDLSSGFVLNEGYDSAFALNKDIVPARWQLLHECGRSIRLRILLSRPHLTYFNVRYVTSRNPVTEIAPR